MEKKTKIGIGILMTILLTLASPTANVSFGKADRKDPPASVTSLRFALSASTPSGSLASGYQQELGRFWLTATPSDSFPGAYISIVSLGFKNLSTAALTNFTLEEVERSHLRLATNANMSQFNNTAAGGFLESIILHQGESKEFSIRADVGTNAPYRIALFRFYAGDSAKALAYDGITDEFTRINADIGGLSSITFPTLVTGAVGSDTIAPTLVSILLSDAGSPGSVGPLDKLTLIFNEKIDPVTINSDLVYGGAVKGVTQDDTAGLSSIVTGTTSAFTIKNIATFSLGYTRTAPASLSASNSTLLLSADGTQLKIIIDSATRGAPGTGAIVRAAGVTFSKIKDTAGNRLSSGAGPVPVGSL